ncbi:MAG: hypothetical protein MMC33_003230 [Icmadophila ericetorum]|nr:hypothetical protein [Icmadophila ericetorum]
MPGPAIGEEFVPLPRGAVTTQLYSQSPPLANEINGTETPGETKTGMLHHVAIFLWHTPAEYPPIEAARACRSEPRMPIAPQQLRWVGSEWSQFSQGL